MGSVTDLDLEAKVAEQVRRINEQRNDPAVLYAGITELFRRIHAGEVEYGVSWKEAHQAVRSGQIYETFEVCSWLIDISSLDDLISES